MFSKTVFTDETDDMNEACETIFEGFEGFELMRHTIALIFVEDETDYPALYEKLAKKWDFPIVGCTALGLIVGDRGALNYGISVMLMTADDVDFAAGVTDDLSLDNYTEKIEGLYTELSQRLDKKEKVILAYGVCVTRPGQVSGDDILAATDRACGGLPIFGGLASDSMTFEGTRVFCNDKVVENGELIILISGNIRPRFVFMNSIQPRQGSKTYMITKSERNVISTVDNEPVIDVLKRENFKTDDIVPMKEYLTTPFMVTVRQDDGEEIQVARNLSYIDNETKEGVFLGYMPMGASLDIGIVNRQRVKDTLDDTMQQMMDMVGNEDMGYHTVLCTSCAARYLSLTNQIKDAGSFWVNRLPEGFSLMGMYSFGEFCPKTKKEGDEGYNLYHNFTFAMLAM